jgi:hypothetical protein
MHPTIREMMLRENRESLERNACARRRRERAEAAALPFESIMLRLSGVRDEEALDRLARLEGRSTPGGQHVVAEVDGTIVAALPLGPGPALADPFRPTAQLIPLLELRARQLRACPAGTAWPSSLGRRVGRLSGARI